MNNEIFIDGVWYPSVTTVLGAKPKPWLDAWFRKWGTKAVRKVKASNAIGTEFHRCVEEYLGTNRLLSTNERVTSMVHRFHLWASGVDGMVDHTELRVISLKHRYSGTLDAIGTLDGKPCIFDWKTSSGIYDDMALQLSAYANAYEEMTGVKIPKGVIVLVSKDKPKHKLTTKEFTLNTALFDKFIQRLEEFRENATVPETK